MFDLDSVATATSVKSLVALVDKEPNSDQRAGCCVVELLFGSLCARVAPYLLLLLLPEFAPSFC